MVAPTPAVLTPSARPGGLVDVAYPLPSGWERGVETLFNSLVAPDRIAPCAVGDTGTEPKGDLSVFQSVLIRQGIVCSALGNPNVEQEVQDVINVTGKKALSDEFYDGAATSNPSLADADSLGTATNVNAAVALLEGDADTNLSGRLAVIHVPVGLSHLLSGLDTDSEGRKRTKAGNLVAIHGSGNDVFATGEVWAGITAVDSQSYTDRRTNTAEAYADVVGIVVFDPEYIKSVTIADEQGE